MAFSTLFGLAMSKDAWVAGVWDYDSARDGWNTCFTKPFNDSELEEADCLLLRIQAKKVHWGEEEEDRVMWNSSSCGSFSMKPFYSILEPRDPIFFL